MRIRVVADDRDTRRIARLSLARVGGMEVLEAGDGPAGIAAAGGSRPDAILLDVVMPGMDGPATLAALRADPATASIPVVFLTARDSRAGADELEGLGAAGVLSKPFDPMTLPDALRALLARLP